VVITIIRERREHLTEEGPAEFIVYDSGFPIKMGDW
jgi:hypothetical protein